jgi:hypothetical protein
MNKEMRKTQQTYVTYCARCRREFARCEDIDQAKEAAWYHVAHYKHNTWVRQITDRPVYFYHGNGARSAWNPPLKPAPPGSKPFVFKPVTLEDIEKAKGIPTPPKGPVQ